MRKHCALPFAVTIGNRMLGSLPRRASAPGPISKPLLSMFLAAQSLLESASVCSARQTLASLCETCAITKPSRGQDGNEERGLQDGFRRWDLRWDLRQSLAGPVTVRKQEVKKASPHVRALLTPLTIPLLASLTLPVLIGWMRVGPRQSPQRGRQDQHYHGC